MSSRIGLSKYEDFYLEIDNLYFEIQLFYLEIELFHIIVNVKTFLRKYNNIYNSIFFMNLIEKEKII